MKTIKTFFILALLMVIGISSASSQLRFGVKGGVDIADHKISSDILDSKNRLGFQIGPMVEVNIPFLGIGIDGALQYGYKKYSIDEKAADATISNYNYLSIPVNLKKRFGIVPGLAGIFVSAGPYANIRLSGGDLKVLDEAENAYHDFKAKNFEMGVNAGLGVELVEKLDIGIYYRCKLTDNYSNDKGNLDIGTLKDKKRQTWSIAATYYF